MEPRKKIQNKTKETETKINQVSPHKRTNFYIIFCDTLSDQKIVILSKQN
jgi:hypothetical protein